MGQRYKTQWKCRLDSGSSRRDASQQTTEYWNNTNKSEMKNMYIANWKAPGPYSVHVYWIKLFGPMHERIEFHLQSCISRGEVPDWMTTGRMDSWRTERRKREREGNEVSSYRATTCLPLMWNLLKGIVADKIYNHREENNLLKEELKGYSRNSRGTKDQLLIYKAVMKNYRRRKVGLRLVWIDYWKAYDMVLHSWIKYPI